MKKLKYILIAQLIVCIFLAIFAFLTTFADANRYARISAYDRILKEEKREFATDKKNEILKMTPGTFSELASGFIRSSSEFSSLIFLVFLGAIFISFLELLIVSKLIKKESIEPKDAGNGVPPSQI